MKSIGTNKACSGCKEIKDISCYSKNKRTPDGLANYCKACDNAQSSKYQKENGDKINATRKIWREANPERNKELSRDSQLKLHYGIDQKEYEKMFERQGGVCFICKQPAEDGKKLYVDHDHKTDQVRKLLCRKHNWGLGQFDDDPDLLRKAADYIERHRQP